MELAELDKIHDASTVVITAIDGMAGVGKTALAVQAAHQIADRYPTGSCSSICTATPRAWRRSSRPRRWTGCFARSGLPGERIPAGIDERAGLYRSRLAEQRMVIVLDNAATETQVEPLLPGAPGCRGAGHQPPPAGRARPHPRPVAGHPVRSPTPSHCCARPPAKPGWPANHRDLVAELVELCGRLPLAIRIAAARLRSHPAWDLAHLVRRLRDQQYRLVELEAGQRSVAAALDLSYQDLDANQRRTYRLLGLHPGRDIDPYAAAALLDTTLREAGRVLEQLLEAHLLQEPPRVGTGSTT